MERAGYFPRLFNRKCAEPVFTRLGKSKDCARKGARIRIGLSIRGGFQVRDEKSTSVSADGDDVDLDRRDVLASLAKYSATVAGASTVVLTASASVSLASVSGGGRDTGKGKPKGDMPGNAGGGTPGKPKGTPPGAGRREGPEGKAN